MTSDTPVPTWHLAYVGAFSSLSLPPVSSLPAALPVSTAWYLTWGRPMGRAFRLCPLFTRLDVDL